MTKYIVFAAVCSALAFACGGSSGGSGVDGGKRVVELSDAEVTDLCEFSAEAFPERTVDCGGGSSITIGGTAAECVTEIEEIQSGAPNCGVTVSQYEACQGALAALSDQELCSENSFPAACAPLLSQDCFPQ